LGGRLPLLGEGKTKKIENKTKNITMIKISISL
jgi:hypothetical protein